MHTPDSPSPALPGSTKAEHDPERPTRDAGSIVGAVCAWSVILVICGGLFLLQLMGGLAAIEPDDAGAPAPESTTADASSIAETTTSLDPVDRPAASNAMLTPVSRMLIGLPENERTKSSNLGALPMFTSSPDDHLRITILERELLGPDETEAAFASLLDKNDDDPALERDIEILRALYSGTSVDDDAHERMASRHGWFWEVALITDAPEDDPTRAALIGSAQRMTAIILGIEIGILLLAFSGLVLFITAVVLIVVGKLRPAFVPPIKGGSVFVEMFALFLVAFVLVTVASMILSPVLGPGTDLLRWSVLGVAAWPVVRGMSWRETCAGLGWHRGAGFFKEIGCGVIGYIACLPVIGLGIVTTLGLIGLNAFLNRQSGDGDVIEAGTEVPVHPIGEMLANAGVLEIVLLAQLATLWAPIVEETFFRGALYRHTRGWSVAPLSGLLTGFLFAAIHPQGWMALPALTAVGFSLAMLREWRGSLIAPIAAHALNNGTLISIMLLMFNL